MDMVTVMAMVMELRKRKRFFKINAYEKTK